MSIEKLCDSSKVYVEKSPYTQISNNIIEDIQDNDAFRLYAYLASKSRDWTVVKEWTARKCDVGERKAKQCWAYLERCGLLEYVQIRNDTGKFTKHDMRILNGSKFNPDEPFLKASGAESAPVDTHRCNNPPSGETTRVDFAPLLKKDITNKDLDTKKSFYVSREEQKKANERKPEWADKPKAATVQPKEGFKLAPTGVHASSLLQDYINKLKANNDKTRIAAKFPTETEVSAQNTPARHSGVQGAQFAATG